MTKRYVISFRKTLMDDQAAIQEAYDKQLQYVEFLEQEVKNGNPENHSDEWIQQHRQTLKELKAELDNYICDIWGNEQ